ncbi:hypothetical protein N7507_005582 [Penicillium longicatenatum]|nr:hypothetical protein N7507_005582 [Penicillium longicatenatum]
MQSDDLMTACCPSGYNLGPRSCFKWVQTRGERQSLGVNSDGECTTGTVEAFSGTIGTHTNVVATLQASPIFLITNTASASASVSTSSTADSSTAGGNTTGLSTGAKIAIGICVPAGVLLVSAALFIFWHRRRKSKASDRPVSEAPAFGDPASENAVSEMPASGPQAAELLASDPKYGTSELTGSPRAPNEMSGDGVFELPGGTEISKKEDVDMHGNDPSKD